MPALVPLIPLIASGVGLASGVISGNQQNRQNQQIQQGMAQTQERQMGLFDQAQQLIPGMQQIAAQMGQANQGFLGDRAALGALGGQYSGLIDQMSRLYGQGNPAGEGMGLLRGLMGQDPLAATQKGFTDLNAEMGQLRADDGGAAAGLMGNAQGVLNATSPDVYRDQARLAGNDAMGQLASQLAGRGIASSGTGSRLGAATLSRLYSDAAARGQQDRLTAYGQANSALSAAGGMNLQRGAQDAALLSQRAGFLGQQAGLAMQGQQHQASLASQLANLGMQGGQYQAGLLGQMGNFLGAQQQNIVAGSGLLGNYLQGLQGQFGAQQGIAGMYTQQGQALGGMWNQQASQVNPNPYGGVGPSLGAIGNAAAWYANQQRQTGPATGGGLGGAPAPGFGVQMPSLLPYRPIM